MTQNAIHEVLYTNRTTTPQGCHVRELRWTDGDGRERVSVELAAETLALAPDWQREQGRRWP